MTPDQADVFVLQGMIDTIVGISKFSYAARQRDAPKPKDEFAHIRVIEEYQIGIPSQEVYAQNDNTTTYRTRGVVKLRYRVGVVDTTGIPSSKIMNGWTSEAIKAAMIESGYGFIRIEPLSSEDAKLSKEWEYRKGFSIDMYTTRVYEETVNNITSMTVSGEFIDEQQNKYLNTLEINTN